MSHLPKVDSFLTLLESFSTDEAAFTALLHPQMEQIEFPNALNKSGQRSDRSQLISRMELGRKILRRQNFEITSQAEQGELAYIEAKWEGEMAVDAGPLKKGQVLSAHFCMAFEFREGKILRQRNYDCFEPFVS